MANGVDHIGLHCGLLRAGVAVMEIPVGADLAGLARRYRLREVFAAPGVAGGTCWIDGGWREGLRVVAGDGRTSRAGDSCLSVTLTSGSTGVPRAIAITHAQRIFRAMAYQTAYREHWSAENPADFLLAMSICHSGFMQFWINQLLIGGATRVLPHFAAAGDFVAVMLAADDAVGLVTPDMCRALLAAAPPGRMMLPGLRALISVGLPLHAAEKRRLAAEVCPRFYDAFGAAGFGMIGVLRPDEIFSRAEAVGRPAAGAVVEVVDGAGRVLPAGGIGHLRCAGPTAAVGWLEAEDARVAASERFVGGYYYPGDLAAMDAEQYITLRGREADLILRGGAEIYPLEIEAPMAAHPAVRDVAVVGRGAEIVAYVVAPGGLGHVEMAAHCARVLPVALRPDVIFYAEKLPRTGNGKLDRPALRAIAARQAR
jgi:acyl-coenzyme A synthetase/AMP-(fatty) acid ligase